MGFCMLLGMNLTIRVQQGTEMSEELLLCPVLYLVLSNIYHVQKERNKMKTMCHSDKYVFKCVQAFFNINIFSL